MFVVLNLELREEAVLGFCCSTELANKEMAGPADQRHPPKKVLKTAPLLL